MITQRMMVRGVRTEPEMWQFTVNTEATAEGEKKTGVPINLYGLAIDNITLTIDWGDNSSSVVTNDSYTQNDSRASVHEYSSPGIYTVQIKSLDWKNVKLFSYLYDISDYSDSLSSLYYFRRTLISLDNAIPNYAGTRYKTAQNSSIYSSLLSAYHLFSHCGKLSSIYGGIFSKNTKLYSVLSAFRYCSSLGRIPDNIFSKNIELIEAANCFGDCTGLTYIPENIFLYNVLLTNLYSCFNDCDALSDFSFHIGSSAINRANSFVTQKSGTTRTIYVPSGSTTETTFNAVASGLGLTIIGE